MGDNRNTDKARLARAQNSWPNTSFLCDQLNEYSSGLWNGITDTAREQGANLFCFSD